MKKTRIKRKPLKRTADRYGPVWEAVKKRPCFLHVLAPALHPRCGMGYAPPTAHHVIPRGRDAEGLLPCCGEVHDVLHRFLRRDVVDFASVTGVKFVVDVRTLGLTYVEAAERGGENGAASLELF